MGIRTGNVGRLPSANPNKTHIFERG